MQREMRQEAQDLSDERCDDGDRRQRGVNEGEEAKVLAVKQATGWGWSSLAHARKGET